MKSLSCNRVQERLGDYFQGRLSRRNKDALRVHLAVCDTCREYAEIWSGLEVAVSEAELPTLSPLSRNRMMSLNPPARDESLEQPRGRYLVASLGALAAAAVLLVCFGFYYFREAPRGTAEQPSAVFSADTQTFTTAEGKHDEYLFLKDRFGRRVIEVVPGTALWLGDNAAVSIELVTNRTARFRLERGYVLAEVGVIDPGFRFIIETPRGEVEARGTVFSVDVSRKGRSRVRVTEGLVEVRRHDSAVPTVSLSANQEIGPNETSHSMATAADVARDLSFLYALDRRSTTEVARAPTEQEDLPDKNQRVSAGKRVEPVSIIKPERVQSPAVESVDKDTGASAAILAIAEGRLAEAELLAEDEVKTNPKSEKTIEMLVKLAQAHRRARAYEKASRIYLQLVDSYPGSSAAANSLVALGQMELSAMGQPKRALAHFTSYTRESSSGILAEEARIGRVRALSRLGRHREVIVAAAEYLRAHPDGRAVAEMLRFRGDAHKNGGDCEKALRYYREVQSRWPDSREAANAKTGMTGCERD
ncbi:MAG: tetratricopeptide repeat protein [Deltaproteobacteria bacterium]|nr:tetratricopeptide repeat protein [Deltaproteobacteria bacterium]